MTGAVVDQVILADERFLAVPRGVEHCAVADAVASVLLFEPAGVRNTGHGVDPVFTAPGAVES